jgi:hypothetical protein
LGPRLNVFHRAIPFPCRWREGLGEASSA